MDKNDILRFVNRQVIRRGHLSMVVLSMENIMCPMDWMDAEELHAVGAPVILIVENGQCRIATDDERNYFYRFLVKD